MLMMGNTDHGRIFVCPFNQVEYDKVKERFKQILNDH
jgi:hypothetical protein